MKKRDWSLRRRLLAWLLVPLLLVSVAMVTEAYYSGKKSADRAYDRLLLASALAIAERVVVVEGEIEVDLPYVALQMLASAAHDRVFYKVAGPDGAFITGYRDLPPIPAGRSINGNEPIFYDAVYRGEGVRIAMLSQLATGRRMQGWFTVHVASTRSERNRLTREIVLGAAGRLLLLIGMAVFITWVAVGRGLAPLVRLQSTIKARSPHDLRPLRQNVPREVRQLVGAINQLMARLGENMAGMHRFIADAAHQLRTPLATLQTQTEVALQERDPEAVRQSLTRLHASTRQTSRLANQLLSLARAAPEGGVARASAPLDLKTLAAEVTREWVPRALERNIDLGFEADDGPAPIQGDAVLLCEMLRNLIDNAVRYCPEAAQVTVRIGTEPNHGAIRLDVEDDGPGIPPEERGRVFERFYRVLGVGGEGCGLGLAIVKEIAGAHGADVRLDERTHGGLLVRVRFPRSAQP